MVRTEKVLPGTWILVDNKNKYLGMIRSWHPLSSESDKYIAIKNGEVLSELCKTLEEAEKLVEG